MILFESIYSNRILLISEKNNSKTCVSVLYIRLYNIHMSAMIVQINNNI